MKKLSIFWLVLLFGLWRMRPIEEIIGSTSPILDVIIGVMLGGATLAVLQLFPGFFRGFFPLQKKSGGDEGLRLWQITFLRPKKFAPLVQATVSPS